MVGWDVNYTSEERGKSKGHPPFFLKWWVDDGERARVQSKQQADSRQTSTQHHQKTSDKIRKVAESASEPGCARVPGQARFRGIRGGRWKALSIVFARCERSKQLEERSTICR